MAINLGNNPSIGNPPTPEQRNQIRKSLGLEDSDIIQNTLSSVLVLSGNNVKLNPVALTDTITTYEITPNGINAISYLWLDALSYSISGFPEANSNLTINNKFHFKFTQNSQIFDSDFDGLSGYTTFINGNPSWTAELEQAFPSGLSGFPAMKINMGDTEDINEILVNTVGVINSLNFLPVSAEIVEIYPEFGTPEYGYLKLTHKQPGPTLSVTYSPPLYPTLEALQESGNELATFEDEVLGDELLPGKYEGQLCKVGLTTPYDWYVWNGSSWEPIVTDLEWTSINNTPVTIQGYGISDAATSLEISLKANAIDVIASNIPAFHDPLSCFKISNLVGILSAHYVELGANIDENTLYLVIDES